MERSDSPLRQHLRESGGGQGRNGEHQLHADCLVVTADVDSDHRGCKFETNFKVKPPVLNPAITVIGGHESVSFKDGSITLTNDPSINQIACQGATVTLSYVLK